MRQLLLPLFTVLLCTCVRAQNYVSVTLQETLTADSIRRSVSPLPVPTTYDVATYKVVYATIDAFGMPDTASGMLAIPQAPDLIFPMTAYMHGTVANREAVPSRVPTPERRLVNVLATNGYIVAAPDYIGLGDSKGFHPYVHAASESSAGRDILLAARQWMDEEGIPYNEQLFITGYSQGGHAAQALQRDLQADGAADSLVVTAGAHLSGPYSISDVMRRATLEQEQATSPGFIVYTYVSYSNVYGLYDDLGEAFRQPYLDVINRYDAEEIDGGVFNAELSALLEANDDRIIDMFQDSIRQQLIDNDDDSPIVQALRDNDTYNWAPNAPTLLVYCTADEQVPFENAILADSVMRALGSTMVTDTSAGPFSHGFCIPFALTQALNHFGQYQRIDATTSVGQAVKLAAFTVSPNPVAATGALRINGLTQDQQYHYSLYDISGRQVQQGMFAGGQALSLNGRSRAGLHLLRITLPGGDFAVSRVVLR